MALLAAAGLAGVALTSLPAPARASGARDVEALVRRKCGGCHEVPAVGVRPLGQASISRHRQKVALSDGEWALLRSYFDPRPDDRLSVER